MISIDQTRISGKSTDMKKSAAATVAGMIIQFLDVPDHYNHIDAAYLSKTQAIGNPNSFQGALWSQAVNEYILAFAYPRAAQGVPVVFNGAIPLNVNDQSVCPMPQAGLPRRQATDGSLASVCQAPPTSAQSAASNTASAASVASAQSVASVQSLASVQSVASFEGIISS